MKVLETNRLTLRWLNVGDANFILQLLNEPSWIQYIGQKNVRSLEDAKAYIQGGPVAMYTQYGFGLFLVELQNPQVSIGLCGLLKRESLEDVDLGFAFLPKYWGKGYAMESASAVLTYGKIKHKLTRIVAITLNNNHSSIKLLNKLGFEFEDTRPLADIKEELDLYAVEL